MGPVNKKQNKKPNSIHTKPFNDSKEHVTDQSAWGNPDSWSDISGASQIT